MCIWVFLLLVFASLKKMVSKNSLSKLGKFGLPLSVSVPSDNDYRANDTISLFFNVFVIPSFIICM